MPAKKIYKCCICHNELEDMPIRLAKMVKRDDNISYRQFSTINNYDFCENCYKIFNKWINKHKKEVKK